MNVLQSIIADLQRHRHLESYATILVGSVLLLISVFGAKPAFAINGVLAAVLVLLYSNILRSRESEKLSRTLDVAGISAFHKDRGVEPHLIPRLLPTAKHDIAMLAVQFSSIVHDYLGTLAEKAAAGCKVKILMMASRDANGNINPNVEAYESQRTYTDLRSRLENTAHTFAEWLASLDESIRRNIEIHEYTEHPTVSMFFVDRNDIHGFLRVEVLHYKTHAHQFPNYQVLRKDDADFYDFHWKSFEALWNSARPLTVDNKDA